MSYLQKGSLCTAFGSGLYALYSAANYYLQCKKYSEIEINLCEIYRTTNELAQTFQSSPISSEASMPLDRLCIPYQTCLDIEPALNSTFTSAAIVCSISLVAYAILTKLKPARVLSLSNFTRGLSERQKMVQGTHAPKTPLAPNPIPAASQTPRREYSYQNERDSRKAWVVGGADSHRPPGYKRS